MSDPIDNIDSVGPIDPVGPVDPADPVDPIDSGRLDWIWDGRLTEQGYTDADLVTTARVLSRCCPQCQAAPGDWCRTATGNVLAALDLQHLNRRRFHHLG